MEPSPRSMRFVPKILLPNYGWNHELAGIRYPEGEMSFRQTIHGLSRSDRGFMVIVDRGNRKILISFDYRFVGINHRDWLSDVRQKVGLGELNPQPYYGFDDLFHKAGTKLLNTFYVQADVKKKDGEEFYCYKKIYMLSGFSFENFIKAIESGKVLIDFDARTGHNHGTKFRLRQECFQYLYYNAIEF